MNINLNTHIIGAHLTKQHFKVNVHSMTKVAGRLLTHMIEYE